MPGLFGDNCRLGSKLEKEKCNEKIEGFCVCLYLNNYICEDRFKF